MNQDLFELLYDIVILWGNILDCCILSSC